MLGAKKKSATGIHIAGRFLRVVELTRTKDGLSLTGVVEEELDKSLDPEDLIDPETRKEISDQLRRIGTEEKIDFIRPCLAVDARAIFLKRRPLIPGSGEKENQRQLFWEAGQFLGEEQISAFSVDFLLTSRHGFIVAVRRNLLDSLVEICRSAGIREVDVDIEPFALYNAAERAGALDKEGYELLVDCSEDRNSVCGVLLSDGEPEATACLFPAGKKSYDPVEETEEWIRKELGGERLRRLCAAGSGCGSTGIAIGERLGAAPVILDPFSGIDLSGLRDSEPDFSLVRRAAFSVAVGLAYRRLAE